MFMASRSWRSTHILVMPGLVPGIHVFLRERQSKTWMAGTSGAKTALRAFCPAMTTRAAIDLIRLPLSPEAASFQGRT
jgi:hypothetical protein